jgi:hypothetical protein
MEAKRSRVTWPSVNRREKNVTQQRSAMTMAAYLAEVRHAVEGLLPLIW